MGPQDGTWLKVGITCDLRSRLKSVMYESRRKNMALFHVLRHSRYRVIEKRAHISLAPYRLFSERFCVRLEDAIGAVVEAEKFVSDGRQPGSRFGWNKSVRLAAAA
jgi:hypothetical protein